MTGDVCAGEARLPEQENHRIYRRSYVAPTLSGEDGGVWAGGVSDGGAVSRP